MEYVISLVLVAVVVVVGSVGLFGHRRSPARPAAPGPAPGPAPGASSHRQPPAYRIVQPSLAAEPAAPGRPVPGGPVGVPAGPVGVPAGPVGVHDGATRLIPAVLVPEAEEEAGADGPDPDAVVLARGHPTGDAPAGDARPLPRGAGSPGRGPVTGPGGVWAPRRP
jgi:hypothetical protein